jgi:hypothetical protein
MYFNLNPPTFLNMLSVGQLNRRTKKKYNPLNEIARLVTVASKLCNILKIEKTGIPKERPTQQIK